MLGQLEKMHLVLVDWGSLCHQLREAQPLAVLQRRHPATCGGLGAAVCRPACAHGMMVVSLEKELSLLRALGQCRPARGSGVTGSQPGPPTRTVGDPRKRRSISFGSAHIGGLAAPRGCRWCMWRLHNCQPWPCHPHGWCAYGQQPSYR